MTATTRMGTFSLWVLGEREGSRPANKISIKDNTIMNIGKNVGDKVVWMQVKSYGNQKELSKREGVIASIDVDMDRLKAIGNGQVPIVAATAWRILSENII